MNREVLTGFGLETPNGEAVCLPSDLSGPPPSIRTPSKARPLESPQVSALATESILLEPAATQLKACEPAIDQTATSAPNPQAISRSGEILRHFWPSQICRWSAPRLLLSGAICAAAVVAATAGVIIARHQNGAVIVPQLVASASNTSPGGPIAAPIQPAEASSAIQFNAGSVDRMTSRPDSDISKSTETLDHLPPRTKTAIGTLSRPVFRSPRLSTLSEPPQILEMQSSELLGDGLLGIFVPGPTPPSTGSNLEPPKLVSSPALGSSLLGRTEKMRGAVVIDALVDATGKVTDIRVISGLPRLTQVAMDALRTWKYEPARLNGQPIAMHMKVTINFSPN